MQRLVFTGLFSLCLSCLMSAWVTFINLGFSADFFFQWGIAYLNAWPAAFVASLFLRHPITRLTDTIVSRVSTEEHAQP